MRLIPILHTASGHPFRDAFFVLVQNPTTLFAYWKLSGRKARMAAEHFGADWRKLHPALRLYDITGISFDGSAAGSIRQYAVEELDSCYLRELDPGRTYMADLGIRNAQSQFLPLLRSNTVHTPQIVSGILNESLDESSDKGLDGNSGSGSSIMEVSSLCLVLPNEYERFSGYTVYPKLP